MPSVDENRKPFFLYQRFEQIVKDSSEVYIPLTKKNAYGNSIKIVMSV